MMANDFDEAATPEASAEWTPIQNLGWYASAAIFGIWFGMAIGWAACLIITHQAPVAPDKWTTLGVRWGGAGATLGAVAMMMLLRLTDATRVSHSRRCATRSWRTSEMSVRSLLSWLPIAILVLMVFVWRLPVAWIRFVFSVLVIAWVALLAVLVAGMLSRRIRKLASLLGDSDEACLVILGVTGTAVLLPGSSVWFVALVANLSASMFVLVAARVWEARGASREGFGPTGWLVVGAWGVTAAVVANVFALVLREPRSWAYLASLVLIGTAFAWGIWTDRPLGDAAAQEAA